MIPFLMLEITPSLEMRVRWPMHGTQEGINMYMYFRVDLNGPSDQLVIVLILYIMQQKNHISSIQMLFKSRRKLLCYGKASLQIAVFTKKTQAILAVFTQTQPRYVRIFYKKMSCSGLLGTRIRISPFYILHNFICRTRFSILLEFYILYLWGIFVFK
jgi:hypothetical protein